MNPQTKKQIIMKCLADGDTVNLPKPSSKLETYLYIWCKGSGNIPTPENKEEMYFAYLAMRIEGRHLDYSIVYRKNYRQFKETVDDILIVGGYSNLIQPDPNEL